MLRSGDRDGHLFSQAAPHNGQVNYFYSTCVACCIFKFKQVSDARTIDSDYQITIASYRQRLRDRP